MLDCLRDLAEHGFCVGCLRLPSDFPDNLPTLQREMPVFGMTHENVISGIIVSARQNIDKLTINNNRTRFPSKACKSSWMAAQLPTTELLNGPCTFLIRRHGMYPPFRRNVIPRKLALS